MDFEDLLDEAEKLRASIGAPETADVPDDVDDAPDDPQSNDSVATDADIDSQSPDVADAENPDEPEEVPSSDVEPDQVPETSVPGEPDSPEVVQSDDNPDVVDDVPELGSDDVSSGDSFSLNDETEPEGETIEPTGEQPDAEQDGVNEMDDTEAEPDGGPQLVSESNPDSRTEPDIVSELSGPQEEGGDTAGVGIGTEDGIGSGEEYDNKFGVAEDVEQAPDSEMPDPETEPKDNDGQKWNPEPDLSDSYDELEEADESDPRDSLPEMRSMDEHQHPSSPLKEKSGLVDSVELPPISMEEFSRQDQMRLPTVEQAQARADTEVRQAQALVSEMSVQITPMFDDLREFHQNVMMDQMTEQAWRIKMFGRLA